MAVLLAKRLKFEQCPQWMAELHRQLLRGKHVILHGNVMDMFAVLRRRAGVGAAAHNGGSADDPPSYLTLAEFLNEYFTSEGCEVVAHYDMVDGLRVIDPGMQSTFDRLIDPASGADRAAARSDPAVASVSGPGAAPARRSPLSTAAAGPPAPVTDLDLALAMIAPAIRQHQTGAAFILNYADKLVSDPSRHSVEEARPLVRLKKLAETPYYNSARGDYAERHNALVLVAPHLAGIPPWFYRDHATLALVQVGRPSRDERRLYIEKSLDQFHGAEGLASGERTRVTDELIELTEGLAMRDIASMRRASRAERISVGVPHHLVNHYRHGERTDPWESIDDARIRTAESRLNRRVFGQAPVVRSLISVLAAARIGVTATPVTAMAGRPRGTFFFVGPTGVGKTKMAKALTELLFGEDTRLARFDMSEYSQEHAADRLTGAPPGFRGYEEGGQLTNRVLEAPFSLLLFDEIEKAHPRVLDKFLQILEDGRLTDGKGQTAYFSQSVIVFTSNIGADSLPAPAGDYEAVRGHFLEKVRQHFVQKLERPELLNRLGDNVLVFDLLRGEGMINGICEEFFDALVASAGERCGLILRPDREGIRRRIIEQMRDPRSQALGGRRVRTLLESLIERPLNEWILHQPQPVHGRTLDIRCSDARGVVFEEAPRA